MPACVEILTGTRRFSLAQREADIAFRIGPFDTPDIVQRRLIQLAYSAYAATGSPRSGLWRRLRLSADHPRHVDRTVSGCRLACAELPERADHPALEQSQCAGPYGPSGHRHRGPAADRRRSTGGTAAAQLAGGAARKGYLDGLPSRHPAASPTARLH